MGNNNKYCLKLTTKHLSSLTSKGWFVGQIFFKPFRTPCTWYFKISVHGFYETVADLYQRTQKKAWTDIICDSKGDLFAYFVKKKMAGS